MLQQDVLKLYSLSHSNVEDTTSTTTSSQLQQQQHQRWKDKYKRYDSMLSVWIRGHKESRNCVLVTGIDEAARRCAMRLLEVCCIRQAVQAVAAAADPSNDGDDHEDDTDDEGDEKVSDKTMYRVEESGGGTRIVRGYNKHRQWKPWIERLGDTVLLEVPRLRNWFPLFRVEPETIAALALEAKEEKRRLRKEEGEEDNESEDEEYEESDYDDPLYDDWSEEDKLTTRYQHSEWRRIERELVQTKMTSLVYAIDAVEMADVLHQEMVPV